LTTRYTPAATAADLRAGGASVATSLCWGGSERTDAQDCWAVGWGGTILRTVDGGHIWRPQASGTVQGLMGVAIAGKQSAWAVGYSDTIVRVTSSNPAPSASSAKVYVNTDAGSTVSMTTIPSATPQVLCHANLTAVATGALVVYHFQRRGVAGDYCAQPLTVGPTGSAVPSVVIYGPLQMGRWQCVVTIDDRTFGTAAFEVT